MTLKVDDNQNMHIFY